MDNSRMNDDLLNYADALATLSNLDTSDAESFIRHHQELLPQFELADIQTSLKVLWSERFPPREAVEMILTINRASILLQAAEFKKIATETFRSNKAPIFFGAGLSFLTRAWPAQLAIMFLVTHPWRARFCSLCGRRFVADKQSRRYCGDLCSHEARKKGKLASWREHGPTWRANQKRRAKKRKSRQSK